MLAVDFSTEIRYSRETRDYDLFIDGEYVGSAASYGEGRHILDQIVLDKLTHGDHLTATQLDGGSPETVSWSDRGDPPGDEPPPETGLDGDEGDDPDAIIDLRTWCRVRDMDGYRPDACGPGSHIDRPIAEKQICKRCKRCCTYVAYRRPGSYRAVAACWPCNRGHEF